MAHAAVVTLMHTLQQILQHPNPHLNPYDQQEIDCLFEKLNFFLDFLEEHSQNSNEQVLSMETKIRDAAYQAEDAIETRMCNPFLSQSGSHGGQESSSEHLLPVLPKSDSDPHSELQKIIKQFDSITEEVVKIVDLQKNITEIHTRMENAMKITEGIGQSRHFIPSRPTQSTTTTVGFEEDLKQVKDRLCNDSYGLKIIPIVGMGGMGKTTLASNVFYDPFVAYHFHIRTWVTLSPQYRKREILLNFLDHFIVLTDEMRKESDEKLAEHLYKSLKGRRYLIVIDDIWSTNAWDSIKLLFPDDNIGSRIIVTTRLTDVASHAGSSKNHHQMRFLTEEQSWNLFHEKVFGQENFPPELEDTGRTIAKNCQGLPLSIVVIGGLLSNVSKALDYWEYVAENLSSIVAEEDGQCSKILSLSFKHLPRHLQACFLYMGVFRENYEIQVSRLIKLWVAEGFLKPKKHKQLDEVAEECLMELISRNLVLVCQKGSTGKIKSCGMHDLWRELCMKIAHQEKFFCVKSKYLNFVPGEATFMRRLSIHDDASSSPSEEDMTLQSMSRVRSFLYTGWDETQLHSYYYFGCLLLRVLDMVGLELTKFPDEILQMVNLRYIAITCLNKIPPSITLLRNLHTLIVEDPCGIAIELPEEIFNMPQLRHLKFSRASLPPVFSIPFPDSDKNFVLENLETLLKVQDLGETKHVLEKMPNVKKLGIHYNTIIWHVYDVHLQKLETLKILFESPANSTFLRSITSAPRLKKITLERGRIGWEDMTIFGSLPNLEVLKLREFAFIGPVWVPIDGEFLKLKYLHIWETDLKEWRADETHFPRLEHLILWKCSKLLEIPPSIGEIGTLEIIEIDYSSPSVAKSAKVILDDQQSQGNEDLQVISHPTKARLYPLKFGLWQDDAGVIHRRKRKLDRLMQDASPAVQNVESSPQLTFESEDSINAFLSQIFDASPAVQNVESSLQWTFESEDSVNPFFSHIFDASPVVQNVESSPQLTSESIKSLSQLAVSVVESLESSKELAASFVEWFESSKIQELAASVVEKFESTKELASSVVEKFKPSKERLSMPIQCVESSQELAALVVERFESSKEWLSLAIQSVKSLQKLATSVVERFQISKELAASVIERFESSKVHATSIADMFQLSTDLNVSIYKEIKSTMELAALVVKKFKSSKKLDALVDEKFQLSKELASSVVEKIEPSNEWLSLAIQSVKSSQELAASVVEMSESSKELASSVEKFQLSKELASSVVEKFEPSKQWLSLVIQSVESSQELAASVVEKSESSKLLAFKLVEIFEDSKEWLSIAIQIVKSQFGYPRGPPKTHGRPYVMLDGSGRRF